MSFSSRSLVVPVIALLFAYGAEPARAQGSKGTGRQHTVTMIDNQFVPREITIAVGDTIVWKNEGDNTHTATADQGSLPDTGDVGPGATSNAVTFTTAGTIPYHCIHHGRMKGKITVAVFAAKQVFEHKVTMINKKFYPREIPIKVGDTIVWDNKDMSTHTATANAGSVPDTGDVEGGKQSKPVAFGKAGTIPYYCKHHKATMTGTIKVE